jgi:CHASE3 domain sensor protein
MQRLVDATQKLHQQKIASENDLLELYNQLVKQEQRVSLLVLDIGEAEAALISERTMRQQVSAKLSEIEALTRAKDAEATQLRDQLTHVSNVAEAQKLMADANAGMAGKESQRADRLAGASALKTKLLIATGGLLLLACVIIILLIRAKLPL